jgi:excisionase family DNA binding protein
LHHVRLSRSFVYQLASEGKLRLVKVGRRSLVDLDSYRRLISEPGVEAKIKKPPHLRICRASDRGPAAKIARASDRSGGAA